MNLFKKLFSRKSNNENTISQEVNLLSNSEIAVPQEVNSLPNIIITSTDNYIKMEIQSDCTLQEYSNELDRLSKDGVDEINQLPMRLLISTGMKTINGQIVYLIKTNGFSYTISANSNNIYLSSRKIESEEIKEVTLKIDLKSKRYRIANYVHDLNRSTKSVKTYTPDEVGNQFSMTTEDAKTTVDLIIEQLEQIGFISEIVDISQIKECLTISKVQELNRANNVQNVSKDR